jgi:hypothetical protein
VCIELLLNSRLPKLTRVGRELSIARFTDPQRRDVADSFQDPKAALCHAHSFPHRWKPRHHLGSWRDGRPRPSTGLTFTPGTVGDTQITGTVTVATATPDESVTITVQNNGYYGYGFQSTTPGQSPDGTDTATVAAIAAPAPKIMFGGSDVTGKRQSVVVGQKIPLTTTVTLPSGLSCRRRALRVAQMRFLPARRAPLCSGTWWTSAMKRCRREGCEC